MNQARLIPFLRPKLEILFVGLNPAKGSNDNGHYFSVNQAFWNQLFDSGLISEYIDKREADDHVFGDNKINFQNWSYGITDLVTRFAESNSSKIKPTIDECKKLMEDIIKYRPTIAILLHGKVLDYFLPFIGKQIPASNSGRMGKLLVSCDTVFYNVAFPHGNSITTKKKVERYREIREVLMNE